jgi:two-component system, OmpR family, response regulator
MKSDHKIKIFLVDDDAVFLKLLEIEFLKHDDFDIKTYATGELCIEHLILKPDVIVLDYNLDGINKDAMNGMTTLDVIKTFNPNIHVIILSSQDNMGVALDFMHHRALDYVMKSETVFLRLPQIITTVFNNKKLEKELGE